VATVHFNAILACAIYTVVVSDECLSYADHFTRHKYTTRLEFLPISGSIRAPIRVLIGVAWWKQMLSKRRDISLTVSELAMCDLHVNCAGVCLLYNTPRLTFASATPFSIC